MAEPVRRGELFAASYEVYNKVEHAEEPELPQRRGGRSIRLRLGGSAVAATTATAVSSLTGVAPFPTTAAQPPSSRSPPRPPRRPISDEGAQLAGVGALLVYRPLAPRGDVGSPSA